MASKYWIKLYHEILYDRKLAALDDHLWRRILECFLMAGEQNEDGYLPPIDDIAWTLRVDTEQLETDLNELVRIGILELKDERYFVCKFATRQEPMEKAEYMRRKREEAKKDEHYQSLPTSDQSVNESNSITKSEGENYINLHKSEGVTVGKTESDTDKEIDKIKKEKINKLGGGGFYIFDLVGYDYKDADSGMRKAISALFRKHGEYRICQLAADAIIDRTDVTLPMLLRIIAKDAEDLPITPLEEQEGDYY